ncbi:hypothetical protein SAM23877_p072 (plasmid) [Streptomyces ambofaciens ATCC 23877]|uniref:Uncharacterized protein n=1 Tax=Streptomyces ambofaciens (strain ATCC 23877 / 3486 / DSM 40053 / JCM 4204 / NBRC 12836 / NRRL B-2516) TaxID=278992 RepID=A0A0K2B6H9_STRA7|nr:hypothetical protein [Streptomyces ambofaciens]AKZ60781.1 hypothetical protein SAM23877_p072 [Streptomyces ambofaciens ATCC 23877]
MVLTHTPAWHAAEEADERAWLDQWARLHNAPTLQPEPVDMPVLLTTAGSPR